MWLLGTGSQSSARKASVPFRRAPYPTFLFLDMHISFEFSLLSQQEHVSGSHKEGQNIFSFIPPLIKH